jgi:hypothetical protein
MGLTNPPWRWHPTKPCNPDRPFNVFSNPSPTVALHLAPFHGQNRSHRWLLQDTPKPECFPSTCFSSPQRWPQETCHRYPAQHLHGLETQPTLFLCLHRNLCRSYECLPPFSLGPALPICHPTPNKTMPTPPLSQPTTLPFTTTHLSHPLCYTDIYIDDFMVLAQHPLPTNTMNMLLHHFNTMYV